MTTTAPHGRDAQSVPVPLTCAYCQQPLKYDNGNPIRVLRPPQQPWEYCRCPGARKREQQEVHKEIAEQAAEQERQRAAQAAETAAWLAELEARERSPEYQAELAREKQQQREAAKEREAARPAQPAKTTPLEGDGWEVIRRQAAKDRKDAELADRERAVKEREIARRERRLDDLDTADADTAPVGATLADLAAVFEDDVDLTPVPAIWERTDGNLILPSGKLSWIYGYPGCGKSFLCEIALIEAVMRGGRVIYQDYEDNQKTFHQRAAILGFHPKTYADSFLYIHGGLSDYPKAEAEALEFLAQSPYPDMNLVIIDAAESSGCPSDGSQINDWLAKVVTPWHNREVNNAVLVADHIPKTKDNRPDGPIGSQRKLAATDGINLLVGGYCWTKKKNGRLTLTNDKDRTGEYAKKEAVATIIGKWDGDGDARGFSQTAVEPTQDDAANANIGGVVLNAIDAAGPAGFTGKSNLYKTVGGNRNAVFSTIDNLVEGGLLIAKKQGQSDVYTLTEEGRSYLD